MRAQQLRTDTMPLTWEVPAAIALSWCLLFVIALPAGQGLAAFVAGAGFAWPRGDLLASAVHLLGGEPGAGLSMEDRASLPASNTVYVGVVITELLVAVVAVIALLVWWRSGGPGTQWGMARRHDVATVLGLANLRRRRHLIRPDLFGGARQR